MFDDQPVTVSTAEPLSYASPEHRKHSNPLILCFAVLAFVLGIPLCAIAVSDCIERVAEPFDIVLFGFGGAMCGAGMLLKRLPSSLAS